MNQSYRERIAIQNGCTHAFTSKDDGFYWLYIGDANSRGFFEKSFKTFREARAYARNELPSLIFYKSAY